ncbi:DNA cytosine methyltransferase [Paenarthrobacter sp. NPDC090522]|uniref:DNA cytosine methyltransferase n=1 Tax=Paenarthrobacter sp. NPDC090522 TaxID=3364383 RepID=UPI0038034EED
MVKLTSVEVCAGAGGQALGLEQAGFDHLACVELDKHACETLRFNRPEWNVMEMDLRGWQPGEQLRGVDLLAGGVPCPPFSLAGKQLGAEDERDLFPEMARLAEELTPSAIMIENVRGLMSRKFESYRREVVEKFEALGYVNSGWRLLNAADFGVPQARQRAILVMARPEIAEEFQWPSKTKAQRTVGQALLPFMESDGWKGARAWAESADQVAPALVGGSKKHGGADLGPTRAKDSWRKLGVDGKGVADAPPGKNYEGMPRLTVPMAAAIQGFPGEWKIQGRKTAAYRQVGNAFPPPVAAAIGEMLAVAINRARLSG